MSEPSGKGHDLRVVPLLLIMVNKKCKNMQKSSCKNQIELFIISIRLKMGSECCVLPDVIGIGETEPDA